MAYTTKEKIREEAGFTRNANIMNSKIAQFQDAATSLIDSYIGKKYVLPLSPVPEIIVLIERKLAAGYLMLDEYGVEAEGTSKDGDAKIKWAEEQLQLIVDGSVQLIDTTGVPITAANKVGLSGWPNRSTGTDKTTNKNDPPIFEIGQRF